MTLDEAIAHAREVAKKLREGADVFDGITSEADVTECLECASEHEQLADWLEELKARREEDGWIPVSERLPKESDFYLVTILDKVTIPDKPTTYVNSLFFMKSTPDMWENDTRIIAWKPLPKPYESEDK